MSPTLKATLEFDPGYRENFQVALADISQIEETFPSNFGIFCQRWQTLDLSVIVKVKPNH